MVVVRCGAGPVGHRTHVLHQLRPEVDHHVDAGQHSGQRSVLDLVDERVGGDPPLFVTRLRVPEGLVPVDGRKRFRAGCCGHGFLPALSWTTFSLGASPP